MAQEQDFTGKYNTTIPPEKQADFDQWAETRMKTPRTEETPWGGRDPRKDRYDYDVNGFYLAGAQTAANGHGDDAFKKPNHTTFSNQSEWQGIDGYTGGQWGTHNGGRGAFQPSRTNLEFHSVPELDQYMNSDAEQGKVDQLPAAPVPVPTSHRGNYTLADLGEKPPYRVKPPQVMTPATAPAAVNAYSRRIYGQQR